MSLAWKVKESERNQVSERRGRKGDKQAEGTGEVHVGRPELALGGGRGFPAPKVSREDASLNEESRAL